MVDKKTSRRYKEIKKAIRAHFRREVKVGQLMERALVRYAASKEKEIEWFVWKKKNFPRIYDRDGGRCLWCHEKLSQTKATLDHLEPTARGGKTNDANITICCEACNSDKGQLTPQEYMIKLGYYGQFD